MSNNIRMLKNAFDLVSRFDTIEDDDTIDKIICYAINTGINIDDFDSIDEADNEGLIAFG